MTSRSFFRLAALAAVFAAAPASAEYQKVWEATGFVLPESVGYDPGTNTLFVSNIVAQGPDGKGRGYVSQIDLNGKVIKEKFIEGLNSPKGIEISKGHLFVAGVEELVEADIAAGKILNRYPMAGASLLNDVAAAPDGRIFVSETMTGAIYLLDNGKFEVWLKDAGLLGPNGLTVDGSRLLVAQLGDLSKGFQNLQPANIKAIDLATKKVSDFGSAAPVGVLDGIEPLGDGSFVVTDNPGGKLIRVTPDGKTEIVATLRPGAADHELVKASGLVIVPLTSSNMLMAYKIQ